MISAEGDVEDEVVQTAESEGQDDLLPSSADEALVKHGERLLLSIRQQELRLNGAAKQFMSFCPLCVKGRHERLVFGRFVSLRRVN